MGHDFGGKCVNLLYFFKDILIFSTSEHESDKLYIVFMTKKCLLKFLTPRAGVLVLGRGHKRHTCI